MNRRHFLTGLAAVGAVSGLPFQRVNAGIFAKEPLIVDGLDTSSLTREFLDKMRKGGVDCVHASLWGTVTFGDMHSFIDQNSDDLTLAKSVADVYQAKKDGKIAVVVGNQRADMIETHLRKTYHYSAITKALQSYHGLGLRILGICYNNNNIFGGGCLNPRSPLTRSGRVLVEEIHKLNIILDVGAHTGEQTSLDAIAVASDIPVICSHTNMAGIMPNVRAISDKLCEAIAKTGGVVGITAISDFHTRGTSNYQRHGPRSPQATLEQHLDQYDYAKKLVGIDHVALGPDFICGWGDDLELNTEGRADWTADMLSDGSIRLVDGFKDISELGNVIKGLKNRGWTQSELHKLLGGNWLRVYKQVWGA